MECLSWHDVREEELEECLRTSPSSMGHELVGRERALAAWHSLLRSNSCIAVAIEFSDPVAGRRIVAFGCSVFVTAEFAARELADPRPGLTARIISSIDSGQPVVLTLDRLRHENTYGGLHLAILYSVFLTDFLTAQQSEEAFRQFAAAALLRNGGYRLVQLIREAADTENIHHVQSQKQWNTASRFEEFHRKNPGNLWNRDRMLFVMDAETARSVPGSLYHLIFQYVEPVLRFSDSQQELLQAALSGYTDEELARILRMKLPAVKKRWASVFIRAAISQPNLLPGIDFDRDTRGPQKRHHLLAYLRGHLEELRPLVQTAADRPPAPHRAQLFSDWR